MTENEQKELNRYQQYYNANKLAYMMTENQKLAESKDTKLLRFDHNTRQVEKLSVTKKVTPEDMAIVEFLDQRKKRMLKHVKERDIDYFTAEEVQTAIEDIEKLGLKDIDVGGEPVRLPSQPKPEIN
jgi:hypothetical protein